jgi:hypothetical protein
VVDYTALRENRMRYGVGAFINRNIKTFLNSSGHQERKKCFSKEMKWEIMIIYH